MSDAAHLSGIVPPLVTPRRSDGSLDVASLRRLVERTVDAGVDGVFMLGSTGEAAFCTDRMRRELLTETVRCVEGRVPVLSAVIDTQTERVLEHVHAAQEAGVDGLVATAPFYAVTAEPEIARHFTLLSRAASVPLYAYDIPVSVHVKLGAELLVALGADGIIAGVKDSSGDDIAFRRLVLANRRRGEPLALLTGHELCVDGALLAGAHGAVPGLANVDPAGYVRLYDAAVRGDWETARHEQDRLAGLMDICRAARDARGWGAGVGAFKTALRLLGVIESDTLPEPFAALTETDAEAVARILAAHGPTP